MENKKNFEEHEFIKNFLNVYAANKGSKTSEELLNQTVGNNGFALGQRDKLTGDIAIKESTIDGKKRTFLVLPTENGNEFSLMSLMGVSSLKGYNLTDAVDVEFDVKNAKQTRSVQSDLIEDFDFADVWQPKSRNLLELAAMIADKEVDLTDKVVVFLGTAVKPFIAKKDSDGTFGESYKKGYKRAIETKLWKIE